MKYDQSFLTNFVLQYNLTELIELLHSNNPLLYQQAFLQFPFDYFLLPVHHDNGKLLQYYLMLGVKMDFAQVLDSNTQEHGHALHYLYELIQYYKEYNYDHKRQFLALMLHNNFVALRHIPLRIGQTYHPGNN